jgi:uroporphyrinogen-III decarboxylase
VTDEQWQTLLAVVRGEGVRPVPTGFIIDSPWLPNWAGYSILDFFTSERIWFDSHMKAIATFPGTIFLPGFWSEYGMCTEPSAFGSVSMFPENEFPFARQSLRSEGEIDYLEMPNPKTYGLLPFVIKRLEHLQPQIEQAGHKIRFAVARGPLNIATFLMGTTEFLVGIKTDPDRMHRLLSIITDYLVESIAWQRKSFPSIDGILLLDDIVGFIGEEDCLAFAVPYLTKIYDTDVTIKFFHNDAPCKVCAPHLPEIGINLLNFGVQHTIEEMRAWTGNRIALLGNIPPRDVLAQGSTQDVKDVTTALVNGLEDRSRLILSCGGGMPPGAPTDNIRTFIDTVNELTA